MSALDGPGTGVTDGSHRHSLQTSDPDPDPDRDPETDQDSGQDIDQIAIDAPEHSALNDAGHAQRGAVPASSAATVDEPDTTGADDPSEEALGRSRIGLFAGVAAAALSVDIVSKVLVVTKLSSPEPKRLMGGAVYLVLARNGGAAFSVGPGATVLFTAVAVIVVSVLVRVASRLRSIGWAVALGLVLGGALGNLTDRLARTPGFGRGHVIDWISLFSQDGHVWPIFNLADSAIVTGGVLGAVLALLGIEINGRRSGPRRP